MEHQKILNVLNESNDSKFVTRNWNIVNDKSDVNYSVRNEISYNTEVLKFTLLWLQQCLHSKRGNTTVIVFEELSKID